MSELIEKIEKALDVIRPYLETDGGNVRILEVDKEMNLILELMGNCGSCSMSSMTLKSGVEEAIKREVPEIKNVHAVNTNSANNPDEKLSFTPQ